MVVTHELFENCGSILEVRVHPVPEEIDREIARLKLAALGIHIDTMTDEQERYVRSWQHGT